MSNRFLELFARKEAGAQANSPAETVTRVVLRPSDLLEMVNETAPKATKGIPEKQALALISAVLDALGAKIDAAGDARLRVPGIGVFRSRDIEQKIGVQVTRVRATGLRRVPRAAKPNNG